jgi:hypothetical protein
MTLLPADFPTDIALVFRHELPRFVSYWTYFQADFFNIGSAIIVSASQQTHTGCIRSSSETPDLQVST